MKHTAGELATYLGASLSGDARAPISGVAALEMAGAEDLIYVETARHLERASQSASKCVIAYSGAELPGKTILAIPSPKLAFAKAAEWLLPALAPVPGTHPTAIVSSTARIGRGVSVGPYAVIEDDVEISERSEVGAYGYVGRGSFIGASCRLFPRVTLYPGTRIGNRVIIHSGAVIGGDGFGYVFGEGRQWKFPQIGTVQIGDDVEIGANATIARGSLGSTEIGKGVKIDNLVHVAHNARVGEHSVIAAQTGISGSSTLGKQVIVGGQVGIGDHCTIEDGAVLGGQAGIPTGKTIRAGQTVWGTPARPVERFKEQYGWFSRLPDLAKRLKRLEQGNVGQK
jgi:UDP-3-O-[3-hydroxymyristoyl] glucosamine N-acyltransferase